MPSVAAQNSQFDSLGLSLNTQNDSRNAALGQADFLRLMTEQLKNQDPLKPLSNSEFLGQLAQFSTVQGIQDLNSSFGGMASALNSDQALKAAALVGHSALIAADRFELPGATTNPDGSVNPRRAEGVVAAPGAGEITVDIKDQSGAIVRQLRMQSPSAGDVPFVWDGLDDAGRAVTGGVYSISARIGSGQQMQQLETGVIAKIESVTLSPQGMILNFAGIGSAPLSAVLRIG